ncbi:hypothetical protein [Kitasatospora sp. MY 5-36]|nr:hypothetical protein [Kitasatospora sp. MY 5-36]
METGADAWRIYWTWGEDAGADHRGAGGQDNGAVLTVLLIGPHR